MKSNFVVYDKRHEYPITCVIAGVNREQFYQILKNKPDDVDMAQYLEEQLSDKMFDYEIVDVEDYE